MTLLLSRTIEPLLCCTRLSPVSFFYLSLIQLRRSFLELLLGTFWTEQPSFKLGEGGGEYGASDLAQ